MVKRHINKHTLQVERGVVYNVSPSLPPKQCKQMKPLFPADYSMLSVSKEHAPSTFTAISFCQGIKFRKPYFQVPVMSHAQLPPGVLWEETVLFTDYFCSLYSCLCWAQIFSELEQSSGSICKHTHTHTTEQRYTNQIISLTHTHTHTHNRVKKYKPGNIKNRSYPPDCQAEERLGHVHQPTISNVLK